MIECGFVCLDFDHMIMVKVIEMPYFHHLCVVGYFTVKCIYHAYENKQVNQWVKEKYFV